MTLNRSEVRRRPQTNEWSIDDPDGPPLHRGYSRPSTGRAKALVVGSISSPLWPRILRQSNLTNRALTGTASSEKIARRFWAGTIRYLH